MLDYRSVIPTPELMGFGEDSLTKPSFGVTSAEVAIICHTHIERVKLRSAAPLVVLTSMSTKA